MKKINKIAYSKLIEEDIAALYKYMQPCLERQHIVEVLNWSIKALYDESEKPIEGIFLLGEKYLLDLDSSAPVEVKPVRYTENGVTCRYLNSWAGRTETISYDLLKLNGFGKTKVRVEWYTGEVTIEHLFGKCIDNYYFNPTDNQNFYAPKEWCKIIDDDE